jgi:hypothetical protein
MKDAPYAYRYIGTYTQCTGGKRDGLATFWLQDIFSVVKQERILFSTLGLKDNVAQLTLLRRRDSVDAAAQPLHAQQQQQQQQQQHQLASSRLQHVRFESTDDEDESRASSVIDATEPAVPPDARSAGPLLVVGNIHVLFNPRRGDMKLAQVRTLVDRVTTLRKKEGGGNATAVICGDFNSTAGGSLFLSRVGCWPESVSMHLLRVLTATTPPAALSGCDFGSDCRESALPLHAQFAARSVHGGQTLCERPG